MSFIRVAAAPAAFDSTDIILVGDLDGSFRAHEGDNDYIRVDTDDGSEAMTWGNVVTNPTMTWLGSGQKTINGGLEVIGGLTVAAGSNLTLLGGINSSGTSVTWTVASNSLAAVRVTAQGRDFITYKTTGNKQQTQIGAILALTQITTIDMADAAHTIVLDNTPAGDETQLVGNLVFVDANSPVTGVENLIGPPEADMAGVVLFLFNTGGEDFLFRDNADAVTIVTVSPNEMAVVACNGTVYRGGIMAES